MKISLVFFRIIFLIILITTKTYSQYKSIENLTEADAVDYLKLEGYQYEITRSEESSGIITWSGSNGSSSDRRFMKFKFWPNNLGIFQRQKQKILRESPDINSWIRRLPYNLKVIERTANAIYASDSSDPEKATLMLSLIRASEPYYRDSRGTNYYFWYENEINFFMPQTKIQDIGFKYGGNNEEFISFLTVDTFDLKAMIETFMLDYGSHILNEMEQSFYKGDIDRAEIYGKSKIEAQPIIADFIQLENGTIAIAEGMNNDNEVNIVVNPINWKNYSEAKRFYIIYHELGHDVFNLTHGNGGKMMYNYADKDVTWKDFIDDRVDMFNRYVANNQNKIPQSTQSKPKNNSQLSSDALSTESFNDNTKKRDSQYNWYMKSGNQYKIFETPSYNSRVIEVLDGGMYFKIIDQSNLYYFLIETENKITGYISKSDFPFIK